MPDKYTVTAKKINFVANGIELFSEIVLKFADIVRDVAKFKAKEEDGVPSSSQTLEVKEKDEKEKKSD